MKRILQKDDTGCGIACIAMLAGTTYKKVKEQFIESGRKVKNGTSTSDLRFLARKNNIEFAKRIRKFKDWDSVPDKSIISINEESDWYHLVVYRNTTTKQRYILDPSAHITARHGRRKDLWRIEKNIIGFYTVTE